MDTVDAAARRNGQTSWPFFAGAAAAAGLVIAVFLAQVTRLIDVGETKLPTIALSLMVATALAVIAGMRATPTVARSGLGSASAGLIAGTAIVAFPLGMVLLPAVFLVGAGAAVAFEAEERSYIRQLSVVVFVIALVAGLWRLLP